MISKSPPGIIVAQAADDGASIRMCFLAKKTVQTVTAAQELSIQACEVNGLRTTKESQLIKYFLGCRNPQVIM